MQQAYPAVRFVVKHGALVAWTIPTVVALAGLLSFALTWNGWLAAGLVVGAAILFCALRVFVELVQVIAETLLPQ